MPAEAPPVMIVGVMNRCGTNFLADVLRCHRDLELPTFAPEDYLLRYADRLDAYAHHTTQHWAARPPGDTDHAKRLLARIGESLLDHLREQITPGKRLLLKTPRAIGLERAARMLPTAKLVLMIRDGRDVVESAARSFPYAGHGEWARRWADGARRILDFTERQAPDEAGRRWVLVSYRELFEDPVSVARRCIAFVDADENALDVEAIRALGVRGSSTARGGKAAVHFSPVERPEDFRPLGRWTNWSMARRLQIELRLGRELRQLGYTRDALWVWHPARAAA